MILNFVYIDMVNLLVSKNRQSVSSFNDKAIIIGTFWVVLKYLSRKWYSVCLDNDCNKAIFCL